MVALGSLLVQVTYTESGPVSEVGGQGHWTLGRTGGNQFKPEYIMWSVIQIKTSQLVPQFKNIIQNCKQLHVFVANLNDFNCTIWSDCM